MKKVLFATTALIATAGIAAADGHTSIAISGSAEMGVSGSDNAETSFFQSVDVRFTLAGETDSGLSFGARIDLDDSGDVAGGPGLGDVQGENPDAIVFISGDFGTLTLGDTDGGFDAGMQEVNVGSPGSIADNETAHAGYSGNSGLDGTYNGQILSYAYSISGFTVTGSVELDSRDAGVPLADVADGGPFGTPDQIGDDDLFGEAIYGIGASYAGSFGGGSYTVGGGYQATADTHAGVLGDQELSIVGVSATVVLDMGLSAGVNYSMITYNGAGAFLDFEGTHTAIGVSYAFDDITVHANYGQYDWDASALVQDSVGYGLAASYSLGAGISAHLGYEVSEYDDVNLTAADNIESDDSTWSLGLSMSF